MKTLSLPRPEERDGIFYTELGRMEGGNSFVSFLA